MRCVCDCCFRGREHIRSRGSSDALMLMCCTMRGSVRVSFWVHAVRSFGRCAVTCKRSVGALLCVLHCSATRWGRMLRPTASSGRRPVGWSGRVAPRGPAGRRYARPGLCLAGPGRPAAGDWLPAHGCAAGAGQSTSGRRPLCRVSTVSEVRGEVLPRGVRRGVLVRPYSGLFTWFC